MALLAQTCEFHDPEALQLFRKGAKMIGELPASGNGTAIQPEYRSDVEHTLRKRYSTNKKMLARMQTVDEHADLLLKQTRQDCQMDRMFEMRVEDIDFNYHSISPRFGVKQGTIFHVCVLHVASFGNHVV